MGNRSTLLQSQGGVVGGLVVGAVSSGHAVCGEVGVGDDAECVSVLLGAGAGPADATIGHGGWSYGGTNCEAMGSFRIAVGSDCADEPLSITVPAGVRCLDFARGGAAKVATPDPGCCAGGRDCGGVCGAVDLSKLEGFSCMGAAAGEPGGGAVPGKWTGGNR